jgi:hypothetical protein
MTDALLERFAALADPTDDSDWLDVRRRARRTRKRAALAATAAAAVVVVTAALAAGSRWVFSTHDHRVTAATSVALSGRTWHVSITSGTFGRTCVRLTGSTPNRTTCTSRLKELGRARPFGAIGLPVPGGQIWVGASIGFARRVVITNAEGRRYTATATAAPKGTRTPFRYWAVAVAGTGTSITAYDAQGRSIRKPLAR